jgi:hypothetical protein
MMGTCPRCSKSRTLTLEGAALACPSCGYTDHVSSLPPSEAAFEPLWAPALMMCIGVSSIVFVLALLIARVAA